MIINNHSQTFAEAYIKGLKDLVDYGKTIPSVKDPTSPASNFGKEDRPTIELLNYSFQIGDPKSLLFKTPARRFRIPYAIGLYLWSLAGSDSVDWLSYYHPFATQYSDDGFHLSGSFGKRLFKYDGRVNQIDVICNRLINDPSTHRALGAIIGPDDNNTVSKEYPCAVAVHYLLREGRLHATTYMRAQQALTVLPFDIFLFMGLQCYISARIGVEVGTYTHFSGTFHIYSSDLEQVEEIISSDIEPIYMGEIKDLASMDRLMNFEERLRIATINSEIDKVYQLTNEKFDENSFCTAAKNILLIHSLTKLKQYEISYALAREVQQPLGGLCLQHIEGEK